MTLVASIHFVAPYRGMGTILLSFEYFHDDVNGIGLLKNIQQCNVHTQVLNGFEQYNKVLWRENFTST